MGAGSVSRLGDERRMKARESRLILDSVILGVVGALCAQLFTLLLHLAERLLLEGLTGYTPPGLPDEGGVLRQVIGPHGLWLIPLATALGGLISGVLVYSLAPEAEGHGTDTAVRSFHRSGGYLRPRVTPLKMVASAVTIGSGGAAGREGPTALFSAGIGSLYATLTRRPDDDRRLLVLVGMAAGLSAIFRSPIGTALFAVEVLYADMEFEAAALLYTMLASVVAYVVNGLFVGWRPLFQVPAGLPTPSGGDYPGYVVLGLGSGLVAALLPPLFYGTRDAFRRIPIPVHFKPALGGLGVGLIALGLPQVLGGGYGWIQEAIDGRLAMRLLLLLVFAKAVAFALTVSSGGSGGVFAPTLFVGAMVGGFLAQATGQSTAAFVVVGMAAVFGGAARVPMATLLMVTEMTGGYRLLVPAALAVFLSYLVQRLLSERFAYRSLYEAQVPARADSPTHHVELLQNAFRLVQGRMVSQPRPLGRLEARGAARGGGRHRPRWRPGDRARGAAAREPLDRADVAPRQARRGGGNADRGGPEERAGARAGRPHHPRGGRSPAARPRSRGLARDPGAPRPGPQTEPPVVTRRPWPVSGRRLRSRPPRARRLLPVGDDAPRFRQHLGGRHPVQRLEQLGAEVLGPAYPLAPILPAEAAQGHRHHRLVEGGALLRRQRLPDLLQGRGRPRLRRCVDARGSAAAEAPRHETQEQAPHPPRHRSLRERPGAPRASRDDSLPPDPETGKLAGRLPDSSLHPRRPESSARVPPDPPPPATRPAAGSDDLGGILGRRTESERERVTGAGAGNRRRRRHGAADRRRTTGIEDTMARTGLQSVDEYIATRPEDVQAILQRVRRTIRKALPGAEETISYQIPAYKLRGRPVLYFAGWKAHYSLYPASDRVVAALASELAPYEVDKGTIRFPLSRGVPVRLIARIARLRAKEAAERATAKVARPRTRR